MNKELVCIGCPMGCRLSVVLEEGNVIKVMGHSCKRGEDYAKSECTNPVRSVCSTVKVKNAMYDLVSVRTKDPIPKEVIMDIMKVLETVCVEAPVNVGDVIVKNILNTGVDIIATKELEKVV